MLMLSQIEIVLRYAYGIKTSLAESQRGFL